MGKRMWINMMCLYIFYMHVASLISLVSAHRTLSSYSPYELPGNTMLRLALAVVLLLGNSWASFQGNKIKIVYMLSIT